MLPFGRAPVVQVVVAALATAQNPAAIRVKSSANATLVTRRVLDDGVGVTTDIRCETMVPSLSGHDVPTMRSILPSTEMK
jgi:hypothetical protein